MASPGAKPKAAHLRIVDGTHRSDRHGDKARTAAQVKADQSIFGKPEMPKHFKGEALKAWKRYIDPCHWLDATREPAAILFCELWQEFRSHPVGFTATKHGQMRHLMSELGLTDERNRGSAGGGEKRDEFFDD